MVIETGKRIAHAYQLLQNLRVGNDQQFGRDLGLILKNAQITYLLSMKCKEKKEVRNIDRKKSILLLSVLAIAVVMSGFAISAYATDNGEDNPELPAFPMHRGLGRGWGRCRGGMFGAVEVSEEYEANAIAIAESDEDVLVLLADGYTISGVRPMIRSYVEADGDVTTTATTAVVIFTTEESTGRAVVWMDLDADSVTKIVILTRTVIEKDAS